VKIQSRIEKIMQNYKENWKNAKLRKFYRIKKNWKNMNKSVGIAVAVGIAIIIGVIGFQIYDTSYQRSTAEEYYEDQLKVKNVVHPENPQFLHGLKINKDKYLVGEKIFFSVQGIPMGLKDAVSFYTPEGILFIQYPFDGNEKTNFKHYWKPSLNKRLNICDVEQLVGEWTVLFAGLPNEKLHFEVTNEILPGFEKYYATCDEQALEMPIMIDPSISIAP
jgi:hypothetical protein